MAQYGLFMLEVPLNPNQPETAWNLSADLFFVDNAHV